MKVFKFGGASVKDAESVKNVGRIIDRYGVGPLVVVISAMGKTTNALEDVINAWWNGQDYKSKIQETRQYHLDILQGLIPDHVNPVWDEMENLFLNLELYFDKPLEREYDFIYDQVVCYGELVSTKIVSAYLNSSGLRNKWLDARNFIITDDLFREARVDWDKTNELTTRIIPPIAMEMPVITQGFIGSTRYNDTTTLGREGSDYSASIFASALNAHELVIWKDVPGILNADPKKFRDPIKFDTLSYQVAIEMTYYGATVLHPKTIKPLQNKNIPLNVRSFIHPEEAGTMIRADIVINKDIPIFISKEKQILVSLSARDYSFIAEENIEKIFNEVVKFGIKVNVMNNSAISFNICIDDRGAKLDDFIVSLKEEFEIETLRDLELLTIKYFQKNGLPGLMDGKNILLEMLSGDTVQYVTSDNILSNID
jgi:aspartate kinase